MRLILREGERAAHHAVAEPDVLQSYGLLDMPPSADHQALVRLAARLCDAPVAYLAALDAERAWGLASYGPMGVGELPRMVAERPCGQEELAPHIYCVQDTAYMMDHHSLVSDGPRLGAFVVAHVCSSRAEVLGALVVGWQQPRPLGDEVVECVATLRHQVELMWEQRRNARQLDAQQRALKQLIQQQESLLRVVSHETRNMLASMLTNCEFALEHLDAQSTEAREALEDALDAARSARARLTEIDKLKAALKQR